MIHARAAVERNTRSAAAQASRAEGVCLMRAELEQPIESLEARIEEMRAYL